jgi:hypothetical protein
VGDDDTSFMFVPSVSAVPSRQHTKHDGIAPEAGRQNQWTMVSPVLWYRSLRDILHHDPFSRSYSRYSRS